MYNWAALWVDRRNSTSSSTYFNNVFTSLLWRRFCLHVQKITITIRNLSFPSLLCFSGNVSQKTMLKMEHFRRDIPWWPSDVILMEETSVHKSRYELRQNNLINTAIVSFEHSMIPVLRKLLMKYHEILSQYHVCRKLQNLESWSSSLWHKFTRSTCAPCRKHCIVKAMVHGTVLKI